MKDELKEQLAAHTQIIAEKDQIIAKKDQLIAEMAKAPKTVNINFNVNSFGKETIDHISEDHINKIISDPITAVANFIKLKHGIPENKNIKVPNKKRAIYQIYKEKEWENKTKGEMLERLYDENSDHLEADLLPPSFFSTCYW